MLWYARTFLGGSSQDRQTIINDVVSRLARHWKEPAPGSFFSRLVERLYVAHPNWTEQVRDAFATASGHLNRLTRPAGSGGGPDALVLLLKGPWQVHALHNYLVGCALRDLGYRVSFVVCGGSVERCGLTSVSNSELHPPFFCKTCQMVTAGLSSQGFRVVNLNDHRATDEERTVRALAELSVDELGTYQLLGVRLADAMRPFLLRFHHGHGQQVGADRKELVRHMQAGARYLLRAARLFDRVRPSCVCLFNGLYFPENLLSALARDRNIRALFTERGMRRNTLFVSADEPACHYRAGQLWERWRGKITEGHVAAARAYLEGRMAGPEDPTGVKRDVADEDEEKYHRLAESPYVVFFAPVTHDTASMEKGDPAGGLFGTLEQLCQRAVAHRKRLIVRSHLDERSPLNPSHYPVRRYLADRDLLDGEFVHCLDSKEKWNPYHLARHADACVIYNGTLGMELPCLGYRIFNVARSHYGGKGFTEDMESLDELDRIFAARKETLSPGEQELALRYLYFHVFVANLAVDALFDEAEPGVGKLVEIADGRQTEQWDEVKRRVAFLLDPTRQGATREARSPGPAQERRRPGRGILAAGHS